MTSCYPSNTVLRKKMIAKYSDDQNYVILTGEVTEFDKNNVIIKCEELRNYLSFQKELCDSIFILKILYNYRLKMK